jgi:hypothetical protein
MPETPAFIQDGVVVATLSNSGINELSLISVAGVVHLVSIDRDHEKPIHPVAPTAAPGR